MNIQTLSSLQDKLGYTFKDPELIKAALTHSSYANENRKPRSSSNERMEFLGDAVLGMTVSTILFGSKNKLPEGRMTILRAELVCERSLAALAGKFDLGSYIKLGRGEEKGGGRKRASILADAMEAVLAAMYLDGGLEIVTEFIKLNLVGDADRQKRPNTDHKTALQEIVQVIPGRVISYHIVGESGPDHMKAFSAEVHLDGVPMGSGHGNSKKEAEQNAAKAAIESM